MAVHCAAVTDYLVRTTNLLSTAGNRTFMAWVRQRTLGPNGNTPFGSINLTPATYDKYVVYGGDGTLDLLAIDVVTPAVVSVARQLANVWAHYAIVTSGTTQRFYVNAVLIGSVVQDITGLTSTYDIAGGDPFGDGDLDIQRVRQWTSALTVGQIAAERLAPSAVVTTGLWMDCPLETDLLDDSGLSHGWTAVGSPTFVSGNTQIELSRDLGTNPNTITQSVNDTAASAFEVWYQYTAAVAEDVIGLWAHAALASNYSPRITIWHGPPTAPTAYLPLSGTIDNIPLIVPVVAGTTYYAKIVSTGNSDPRTASLVVSLVQSPAGAVPIDSLMINDDTAGFPLIGMNSSAVPLRTFGLFPAGECAEILPDGTLLVEARIAQNLMLYSPQLALITTIPFPAGPTGDMGGIGSNQAATFYVGRGANNTTQQVNTISTTGVVGATSWTLTNPGVNKRLAALAPSLDETVLYYHTGTVNGSLVTTTGQPVQRWDLVNNVALSDLAPGVANYARTRDLPVLADGTILSGLFHYSGTGTPIVRRYSAAGATIQDYTFPTGMQIDHITHASDDPFSFWVWLYLQNEDLDFLVSRFLNVRVSDGVILSTGQATQYEEGVYQGAPAVGPARFGHSRSCAFWVQRAHIPAPPIGDTGTIVVEKITSPSSNPTSFDFTTTGLTPATFRLSHGQSRTFDNLTPGDGYGVLETPNAGFVTTYVVSDGSPIDALDVAAGEVVTVTVTNRSGFGTPVRRLTRRLIRTTIMTAEQQRVFHRRLVLELEVGLGLREGQGSNPMVMMRWSDDAGHTFSNEYWASAGPRGQYARRVFWDRLGVSRNRVYEFTMSDAVPWSVIACFVNAEKGLN